MTGGILCGCGYTFTAPDGVVPAEVRTIHVDRVDVGEADVRLGDSLAREFRRYMTLQGRFTPSPTRAAADAVLAIKVMSDETRPVAFDQFDEVLSYDSRFAVSASLTDGAGKALWRRKGIELTRSNAAVDEAVVTSSSAFQSDERLSAATLDGFDAVQLGEDRRTHARGTLTTDMVKAIYAAMVEGY